MALIEFMRFRVRPDNTAALLQARSAMIDAYRADDAGYLGGLVALVGERDWLDVAVWADEAACDASLVRTGTATAAFLGLMDEVLGQERGTVVNETRFACATNSKDKWDPDGDGKDHQIW